MSHTESSGPRVTIGIATYNRDTFLAEAIASCLDQDFPGFEVLVVCDGSTNPRIEEVLADFTGDPRLRVIRHPTNLGIAAAYNTFVSEGRGELIAMLGDDDVCLPGRIARQVAVFDRHPETGVVHGDATVIDARGRQTGLWNSFESSGLPLVGSFFRRHNHIVDPTRMVHRKVYATVGDYDARFPLANDFDFYLRAARHFRFRHCAGGPLVAVRRHGENTSDERAREQEQADVDGALQGAVAEFTLRELVPELDWALLDEREGERQALLRLADAVASRAVPAVSLAEELRARAAKIEPVRRPRQPAAAEAKKLMMTSFGWNDSGGGTTVPRLAAKELARRGWDVTVFHAAAKPDPSGEPYAVREWEEDGVRLIGVHNRAHGLFDFGQPARELDDPPISAAFCTALDRLRPDVVHFHNLHNLGAALFDHAAARGLPAYFTTHNYWLVCPRIYLLTGRGEMCGGPGDGARCASCVSSDDDAGHRLRLAEIRSRAERGVTAILAVSEAMRETLVAAGYPPEMIDVVRQAMPHDQEIWTQIGRDRRPGRVGDELTVGFLGSAYPHKGPQLLVSAAQRTRAKIRVQIHGEVPPQFASRLLELDRRGVVELCGAFAPSEIAGRLAGVDAAVLPSMWWDCAPLAAAECRAARTPLVVPRLGGLPEVVRDGVDGLTFDGLDADDLARALDRLAEEPGLLERLQAGIEAPRAFSSYVDELEAYYAGKRPPVAASGQAAPAVRWQGDQGKPTSLSIINGQVSRRLPARLQRVRADGVAMDAPLPHAAALEVRHQWPPDLSAPEAGRLAAIVPWEFGAVPQDWVSQIEANVDELWVPSEYVRRMYLEGGVPPERVVALPNGVDLERFNPAGERLALDGAPGVRFLFVGGLIWRKGADLLLDAWRLAFAGREDVTLVVKDFGAGGVYRGADRSAFREHVDSGALPRVLLLQDDLSEAEIAGLYRACDVLVHPYRGEGFGMPVLEAMASGLPVITTAGGPTDEFCPEEAAWRIASSPVAFPENRVDAFATAGRPWVLEPDRDHLVELLRAAAGDEAGRQRRGKAAEAAARRLSWDLVAELYAERVGSLVQRRPLLAGPPQPEPFPLEEPVALRILATPAWRGHDELAALLATWCAASTESTSACLYLLADPAVDGDPEEIEGRVLAAATAAGVTLEGCADINVLIEPFQANRDRRLHAAVNVYVPLHAACAGHVRLAAEAGHRSFEPGDRRLAELLAAAPARAVVAA